MKLRADGKRCYVWTGRPILLSALAILFAVGILLGYFAARRFSQISAAELQRYFTALLTVYSKERITAEMVLHTLWAYFRTPLAVFLLGFASVGVVLIPGLCVFQSFAFSFALFCYLCAMGRSGFWLMLAVFAVRFAVVLPCTMYLCALTFRNARSLALYTLGRGKRVQPVRYSASYFYAFAACCIVLLLGALLELILVPRILLLSA